MALEFLKTQKGKPKLALNGYQYIINKRTGEFINWECEKRRSSGCNARIRTHGQMIVTPPSDHICHAPDAARLETSKIIDRIKARAEATHDCTRDIITTECATASAAVQVALSTDAALRRKIQRERNTGAPVNPTSFSVVTIPNEYRLTTNGEPFLQFDSGMGPNRIVIYCSPSAAVNLAEASIWFCDGTFSVCPNIGIHQLFTVHALVGDRIFPCAYGILPDKRQATYTGFFEALQELSEPDSVMMDFELAEMNAFQAIFPDADLNGCFFHLKQACYRKIQSLHLVGQYANNMEFWIGCRMLPALAFVPPHDVIHAFRTIVRLLPAALNEYKEYFEQTYIRRRVGCQFEPARYPIGIWNQYDNAISDRPRTNNAVEGWHRAFQLSVGGKHPNVWKFVGKIQQEEDNTIRKRNQQDGGHPPEAKKKKYKDLDARIHRQVLSYNRGNIVRYLRSIAYNIRF